MRNNPTRSGFLLLMLIAFASILLGLATTFYYYTSRGMDDSQTAVRLAQQRLALAAALKYFAGKVPNGSLSIPIGTFYASSGDGNAMTMSLPGIPRTQRMGWFRIALANNAYMTANAGIWPGCNDTNSVFITAGNGPSEGKMTPVNPNDWQFELRSWYLLKLNPPTYTLTPVFPPPAEPSPSTIIYW